MMHDRASDSLRRLGPLGLTMFALLNACYSGAPVGQEGARGEGGDAASTDSAGGGDDPESLCRAADVGKTRLRRLTREQYENAVADLIGVEGSFASGIEVDEKIGAFSSNYSAPVGATVIEQYLTAAELAAEAAAPHIDAIVDCDTAAQGEDVCADRFIARIGRRAYRRPLTEDERARYRQLFDSGVDFGEGARLVIRALLQSPHFLYHLELEGVPLEDGSVVAIGDYELASRLSFFLWNSIPDEELLDVAASGTLTDDDTLMEQAERMLEDPRARRTLTSFHRQWLGMDELERLEKDPDAYPLFDEAVRASMAAELTRFVEHVMYRDDGTLGTLLTASYGFVDAALAPVYGVEIPADHDPSEPVEFDPSERAGVLTMAGFLATNAHANQSAPIKRGVTIRTNFFCSPPPPPPPALNIVPPDPDPNATTREIFEQHTADPSCAGCHTLIDGIGLGMEGYDGIGLYRTEQNGLPVDQTGELVATDVDGPFTGAPEMAQRLAQSEEVRDCFARQWFRFSLGRYELEQDACSIAEVDRTFAESGNDVRSLMLAIVKSDAFRHRRAPEGEVSP